MYRLNYADIDLPIFDDELTPGRGEVLRANIEATTTSHIIRRVSVRADFDQRDGNRTPLRQIVDSAERQLGYLGCLSPDDLTVVDHEFGFVQSANPLRRTPYQDDPDRIVPRGLIFAAKVEVVRPGDELEPNQGEMVDKLFREYYGDLRQGDTYIPYAGSSGCVAGPEQAVFVAIGANLAVRHI